MVGFYGGSPLEYAGVEAQGSDAVSSGVGAGAAFNEGLALNPTGRIVRQIGRTASETGVVFGDPFGGGVSFLEPETDRLDPAVANAEYEIPGVLKFDQPVTRTVARDLFEAKRAKIERDDTLARSEGGVLPTVGRLSAALGASLLDPINVAAGFIPIIGPAREAALIAQAGSAVGRAGVRAGVGAGAGAAGMAALQPLEFALSRQEREDYTMAMALRSIALGTVLGGGLHVGVGGAIDRATGRYRNRIEDAGPDARQTALHGALAQTIEGRPVEVAPVFETAEALRPLSPEEIAARASAELDVEYPGVPPARAMASGRAPEDIPIAPVADVFAASRRELENPYPGIRRSPNAVREDMFAVARREPEVEPQARVAADEAAARLDDTLQTIQKEIADLERMTAPPETPVERVAPGGTQRAVATEQAPAARPERPTEADLAAEIAEARASAIDRAALCITRGG